MRPFVLKGHERPITWVVYGTPYVRTQFDRVTHRYNREGDLLFTCGKVRPRTNQINTRAAVVQDFRVCLWYDEDGEMIGTYNGHNGSVNTADVTCETSHCFDTAKRVRFLKGRLSD